MQYSEMMMCVALEITIEFVGTAQGFAVQEVLL